MKANILYALEKFRTIVIVGETGSGKSTQIPQVRILQAFRDESQVTRSSIFRLVGVVVSRLIPYLSPFPVSVRGWMDTGGPHGAVHTATAHGGDISGGPSGDRGKGATACFREGLIMWLIFVLVWLWGGQMNCPLGSKVGYAVRFDQKVDAEGKTAIKFVTDGLLLREVSVADLQ